MDLMHIAHSPNRLKKPLRRTKGGWKEISWDEAYSEIVDRSADIRDKWGAGAIVIFLELEGIMRLLSTGLLIYSEPQVFFLVSGSLGTLLCSVRKAN